MEHFGLDDESKALGKNVYKDEASTEDEVPLSPEEQKSYRALAARGNCFSPGQPLRAVLGEGGVPKDVLPDVAGLPEVEETCTGSGRTEEREVGLRVAVRGPSSEPPGVRGQ